MQVSPKTHPNWVLPYTITQHVTGLNRLSGIGKVCLLHSSGHSYCINQVLLQQTKLTEADCHFIPREKAENESVGMPVVKFEEHLVNALVEVLPGDQVWSILFGQGMIYNSTCMP